MKQRNILAAVAVTALLLSGCAMAEAAAPGSEAAPTASWLQHTSRGRAVPVLTKEQAQAIAFAYLGLEESRITGLETELEEEDGVLCYDVQFRQGRREYAFQINAQTGQIVSFYRDD